MTARVLHIQKATGLAGSEKHLVMLLERLSKKNITPKLVVLHEPENVPAPFVDLLNAHGVPHALVPIGSDISLTVLPRLVREIRSFRPDIVHTHLLHADLYGTIAARLAGCKNVVSTRHNDDPFRKHFPVSACMRGVNFLDRGVIYISQHLKNFYDAHGDARISRRAVIHYGLELVTGVTRAAAREALGLGLDEFIFGIVARLVPQKGHDTLLEAFAAAKKSGVAARLAIVGEGELRSALMQRAESLGIGKDVLFAGFRADAADCISAFDVFVHPSRWEGFGLVLLEAMARGVPVIATNVSAIPEIVEDGKSGVLVAPDNALALSQAMTRLYKDTGAREAFGSAGRKRVASNFSADVMAANTAAFYTVLTEA